MFKGSLPTEQELYGTWEISEAVVSKCDAGEGTGENLKGVQFTLHDEDELTWKLTSQAAKDELPFFSCETYETFQRGYKMIWSEYKGDKLNIARKIELNILYCDGSCVEGVSKLRFYGKKFENWIEFKVSSTQTKLALCHDQYLELFCIKISKPSEDFPNPLYSFLDALREKYFSDLTLTSRTGEQFAVHKTILSCTWPHQEWDTIPDCLRGLPSGVLMALLHYLYSGCLPRELREDTTKQLFKVANSVPKLRGLTRLCTSYLEATAVKLRLNGLVNELEQSLCCVVKVVQDLCSTLLHGQSCYSTSGGPSRIFETGKTVTREAATGGLRLILICEIFTQRKSELTREERHEVIKSIKARLPGWFKQVHSMLLALHACLSQLSDVQKEEIAKYLIPEIECVWETMTLLGNNMRSALEQIVHAADGEKDQRRKQRRQRTSSVGSKLSRTLRNAIHIKEVTILKKLQEKVAESFIFLIQKREDFSTMTQGEKLCAVTKFINKLSAEVPYDIRVLERFPQTNNLSFKEWKYLFKVGSARVSWTLERMKRNKAALLPLIQNSRALVKQEAFDGILKELQLTRTDEAEQGSAQPCSGYTNKYNIDSLTTPPSAAESELARAATALLDSGRYTDMTFIVTKGPCVSRGIPVCESARCSPREGVENADRGSECAQLSPKYGACPDTSSEENNKEDRQTDSELHSGGGSKGPVSDDKDCACGSSNQVSGAEFAEFRAHRVILSARCDWFRRALLSGMKESIDRQISIPYTNPALFKLFLWAVYRGSLDTSNRGTEQLADLMTLADQYEAVSVKRACELALCSRMTDDSALVLFSLADQYAATQLKENALAYIRDHPGLTSEEEFDKLSPPLQQEIVDMLQQSMCTSDPVTEDVRQAFDVCGLDEFDEIFPRPQPSSREARESRVEQCIRTLADVLGDVPRRELIRITLAADCDVNRALNFYFC